MTTATAPTATIPAARTAGSGTPDRELWTADCGHLTDRAATVPCGDLDNSFDCEACAEAHIDGCTRCARILAA